MTNPETKYPELLTMKHSEILIIAIICVTDLTIRKIETKIVIPKKNYDLFRNTAIKEYKCDEIYLHTIQK